MLCPPGVLSAAARAVSTSLLTDIIACYLPAMSGLPAGVPTPVTLDGSRYYPSVVTLLALAAGSLPPPFLLASGTCLPSPVRAYNDATYS